VLGSRDDATGYVDTGLCPDCVRDGYEEAGCGCVTTPAGELSPCGTKHRACDSGRTSECSGLATEQLAVPYLKDVLHLCAECAAFERQQLADGPREDRGLHSEGGVRYDPRDARR
jgi:hypothetical protein